MANFGPLTAEILVWGSPA